jgi:hypothetical protein
MYFRTRRYKSKNIDRDGPYVVPEQDICSENHRNRPVGNYTMNIRVGTATNISCRITYLFECFPDCDKLFLLFRTLTFPDFLCIMRLMFEHILYWLIYNAIHFLLLCLRILWSHLNFRNICILFGTENIKIFPGEAVMFEYPSPRLSFTIDCLTWKNHYSFNPEKVSKHFFNYDAGSRPPTPTPAQTSTTSRWAMIEPCIFDDGDVNNKFKLHSLSSQIEDP